MTTQATTPVKKTAQLMSIIPNTYTWVNPYGGSWGSASNWQDVVAGAAATSAPNAGDTVSISGGTNFNFADITGTGAAAQLSITNDVLVWGSIAVSGAITLASSADLDLDGARVATGSLNLGTGALLGVGNSSTLVATGSATLAAGSLVVTNASTLQLGSLIANAVNSVDALQANVIAVDDSSSVEVGTTGNAAAGSVTIDRGASAAAVGTIDGNIVVNGNLGIQAYGHLTIDLGDPFGTAQSITGGGTLTLSQDSLLTLGVVDSAAIRFGAPAGTLDLHALPTGTISGFTPGDLIEIAPGPTVFATGLTYTQTSLGIATLTLTKAGRPAGTLSLAGNYAGSLFHYGLDASGNGLITVRTIGSAPLQPNLILGTAGLDTLNATAANQTLTGFGGNDVLGAATFTGINFKDTTANLNGSTITAFSASDVIDLTDLKFTTASVSYTSAAGATATLVVTDGTQTATIGVALSSGLPPGYFMTTTDGATGTKLRYTTVNTDAYAFSAAPGGSYATASKWQDTSTGNPATVAPTYGNAVTVAGGAVYTNVTGSGLAASLQTSGSVLLWGSLAVGGRLTGVSGALVQTGTLALDGGANVTLTGSAAIAGLLELGGGSKLAAAGGISFSGNAASLLATTSSSAQFATILAAGGSYAGSQYAASAIGVDATSSIEFGTIGNAAAGALTIDNGVTANLSGTIRGNVIVNGTLAVAGTLGVAAFASAGQSVTGTGTVELVWGDTLNLAGLDSAAILFNHTPTGVYSNTTETLALGGSPPTGTINGFAAGDVITLVKTITNLSYSQIGAQGRLTLFNGGITMGTLLFSGSYVASQFQLQLSADGLLSTITYAPAPNMAVGNQINSGNDRYAWTNTSGGGWTNAGNWTDTTTGITPAAAPGAGNAVIISGSPGPSTAQIISGSGSAASLIVAPGANTVFTGTLAVAGQFSVNNAGITLGSVTLANGANFTVGTLNVSSPLEIAGNSSLTVAGSSTGNYISGGMTVIGGSTVKVTGGTSVLTGMLAIDGSSGFELGAAGGTAVGTVTIDNGQTLTLQGMATIAGKLVLNGNLMVYSGTLQGFGGTTGSISGPGTIAIGALGASGSLLLNASNSAAMAFIPYSVNGIANASESLELAGPLPTGMVSGFVAGDTIVIDRTVTAATFKQTSMAQGLLTLTNGSAAVGTLTLMGNYTTSLFHIDIAAATGFATLSVQTSTSTAGTAAASTGRDAYTWAGASGGSWTTAASWKDTTIAAMPITIPGSGVAVTIPGNPGRGQYTTIGGSGAAASIAVSGNVVLTGQISVAGAVQVAAASGAPATLALDAGAKLTSGGSLQVTGKLEVEGGSTVAAASSYATLMNGSLLALGGSTIQAGGLLGLGNGDVIAVDASSVIKVGAPVTAFAGTLTQAAGAPIALTGSIYANVVANGTISVAGGGALFIDMNGTIESDPYATAPAISGSGTLAITEGSTLGLGVVDSVAIQFAGPNATLALAAIPTATITGFVVGDQIQVDLPVTGMAYKQATTTSATLTLTNGANTVGILKLAGTYGGGLNAFHLDAAANGNTAVITLQSLAIAAIQPTLIQGTVASDLLIATANNQTITGLGAGDNLSGGAFTGIGFKDLTAYLNGDMIQNFTASDFFDFTDMKSATAIATYSGGALSVTDGTHTALITLGFASTPATGSFHVASDGTAGTKLTWS